MEGAGRENPLDPEKPGCPANPAWPLTPLWLENPARAPCCAYAGNASAMATRPMETLNIINSILRLIDSAGFLKRVSLRQIG
jgi:hypothetical protein